MPQRDGTGPMGAGAMTGRGHGACTSTDAAAFYQTTGLGCQRRAGRRGMQGRVAGRGIVSADARKEMLEQQRNALQKRLDSLDGQLTSM